MWIDKNNHSHCCLWCNQNLTFFQDQSSPVKDHSREEEELLKNKSVFQLVSSASATQEVCCCGTATAGQGFQKVRPVQMEVCRAQRHHQHFVRHRASGSLQGRIPQEAKGILKTFQKVYALICSGMTFNTVLTNVNCFCSGLPCLESQEQKEGRWGWR